MMRHAAVLLLLVLALPHRGLAQTGASSQLSAVQPLSLDDAIRIALKRHPAVKQAEAAVLAAEARVKEARASYYPQLSFRWHREGRPLRSHRRARAPRFSRFSFLS